MKKILVANRGEIAVRIIRACKEMNIESVAVYSLADKNSMHVKIADEAICIGPSAPSDSYNNKQAILSAAIVTSCDAVFPGYGFLSEDASFASMVENHGFTFIGPHYSHIQKMGDKITAKNIAAELGIPLVPGTNKSIKDTAEAKQLANEYGYPIVLKASGGGGGKGIRIVHSDDEMELSFQLSKSEAKNFPNDDIYIEKYIQEPKHIEVQLLGDKHGNLIHLFERECSLQRNHQKVLEEAPSPSISESERLRICELTANAMKKLGYYSAGTVEYMYSNGQFYFLEMNTRIQVEHTITEMITGIDIVFEMINIAQGKTLSIKQSDVVIKGHALQCRILAEDPETFIPSPGKIVTYHPPAGLGVRVDTNIYTGYSIPPFYDSMIAKLIIIGTNRSHCIKRAELALEEFIIEGVKNSIPLHIKLLKNTDFLSGDINVQWLENKLSSL